MFTVGGIRKFHDWTHASLNLVLDHLSTIPREHYAKEVPNFGFRTLREQTVHIFNCEAFWVHVLQGKDYFDRTAAQCPAVEDARRFQEDVRQATEAYLSTLSDGHLNTHAELRFSDGDAGVHTPALVLHHVLTHAFHHKGQIVAMCRALGYPAPDTDLNQVE